MNSDRTGTCHQLEKAAPGFVYLTRGISKSCQQVFVAILHSLFVSLFSTTVQNKETLQIRVNGLTWIRWLIDKELTVLTKRGQSMQNILENIWKHLFFAKNKESLIYFVILLFIIIIISITLIQKEQLGFF